MKDPVAAAEAREKRFEEQKQQLEARIAGLVLTEATSGPLQLYGTLVGYPFYFRYRHGSAQLRLSAPGGEPLDGPDYYNSGRAIGDEYDDAMTWPQLMDVLVELVAELAWADFTWTFSGRSVEPLGDSYVGTYEERLYRAVAPTAQAAFQKLLRSPSGAQLTPAQQAQYKRAMGLHPTPLQADDRLRPEPEVDFAALIQKEI